MLPDPSKVQHSGVNGMPRDMSIDVHQCTQSKSQAQHYPALTLWLISLCHSLDLRQDLVGIEDAVGVKCLLDLGHQIYHGLWLCVPAE